MEIGFQFGEKYIQKVWLYTFPGTRSFLAWQSCMKFMEEWDARAWSLRIAMHISIH